MSFGRIKAITYSVWTLHTSGGSYSHPI